jgi:hypothetical protein
MKSLFSFIGYILSFQWSKATTLVFKGSEEVSMKELDGLTIYPCAVRLANFATSKEFMSDLYKLGGGKSLPFIPEALFNVPINPGFSADLTTFLDGEMEAISFHIVCKDSYKHFSEMKNSLKSVVLLDPFWHGESKLSTRLEGELREHWMKVKKRRGLIPIECPNCSNEDYEILSDGVCDECDVDLDDYFDFDLHADWKQMYKEIKEYEEVSGKQIFSVEGS